MSEGQNIVQPGGLIAILGGGQLGRMTAMAARTMGYRIRVMDPEPTCPASFIADETIVGHWDDADAGVSTGRRRRCSDSRDRTNRHRRALPRLRRSRRCVPGVEPVRIIQDKTLQKIWLADEGFPVGEFRIIDSPNDCEGRRSCSRRPHLF